MILLLLLGLPLAFVTGLIGVVFTLGLYGPAGLPLIASRIYTFMNEYALVAVPMLRELGGDVATQWLPRIAAGEAKVAVGLEQNLLVEDAHTADLLLMQQGDAWYALKPEQVDLRHNQSVACGDRCSGGCLDPGCPGSGSPWLCCPGPWSRSAHGRYGRQLQW